jgi:predicted transcriptional regulator
MAKPSAVSLELDPKTNDRLQHLASARSRTPEAILREALTQYLDREEHPAGKNYPRRSPVGGIITPM